MSNIISKIRQRIALKENNKFDLTCDHITTTDFMRLSPVYFKEMVPGEKINIKQSTFTRLSPLINPMYGRCRIENRAFFVPMRTIMPNWNEFITDVPVKGSFVNVPTLSPKDIAVALVQMSNPTTGSAFDFEINVAGDSTKYKFRTDGKIAWNILCSLGYRIPIGYWIDNDPTADDYFSALPLLAFFKIYYDWFKNQAYQEATFDGLFDGTQTLVGSNLPGLLGYAATITYDKDYFTSAWDNPVAPNNMMSSPNDIPDVTNDGNTGYYKSKVISASAPQSGTSAASTPNIVGVGNGGVTSAATSPYQITQYCIDALKKLTDYIKRHQIAGGLAMDRMLARFGMKPSDAALKRSVYLGKHTVDVQIADVMATANGTNQGGKTSQLGDYAGKGVGLGNGSFSYETNEYGYIVITSSLVPSTGYVQGCSRYNLHKDRLDFFTPEFDSLGVQAIAKKELLSDYNGGAETEIDTYGTQMLNGVFGYTSRYAEYKTQMDNLTGDFGSAARNTGLYSWHLFRSIDPQTATPSTVAHNLAFVSANDATQYDRIFSLTGNDYDHFINIHHFEITDYAPMAKLFDDYEFDGGKKDVTIEVNGTQLN